MLFADIVGSTALGERLGPAEVKALVGECVTQMSRAVEEYGGTVQAYQGDGICAYFGVPSAHEDDPERAARTALRILEVLGEYARDICDAWGISGFNVRVGVNAGQAGVGLVGAADPQAVALGDTTNVAARLEASAQPGTILVGEGVARRLSHRFVFEPVGDIAVKGRAGRVAASRLVRAKREERPAAAPPLVDREAELERLSTAMRDLHAGRGQVLLLVGDPGIGKSRLLAELRSIASDEVTWLEGECLSYGGLHSWPLIEVLRRWLGVEPGDAEIAVRTKAQAKLGAVLGPRLREFLPAFGRLLQIRIDRDGPTDSAAEDASDDIERAYLAWIEALAAERPVVLALEDMQWAHSSTRRIAEALLALTDRVPLLLVATTRREPASEGWRFRLRVLSDYAHRSTELALARLSDEASGRLLDTLLPGALDGDSRAELIARAEGNPLYLEELLQALVQAEGVQRTRRAWTVTPRSADLLPPALENLLVARIDRLADGPRRLAQAAAAIGRAFPLRVLEHVFASDDLQQDLEVLLRAEVVHELRRYPEREYSFKHGLLQEAALSTLTPQRRRELYRRVAAAFEELGTTSLEDQLERLAHYYAQGDDLARALAYLEQAATAAEALNAVRARDLWSRAEALASRLGDSGASRRVEERLRALRA